MEKESKKSWSWRDLIGSIVYGVIIIVQVAVAILFFNSLNNIALLFIGGACFAVFLIMGFLAGAEFRKKGSAPEGKSLINTTVIVDSGIYSIVRHPMYTSWIFLVLALIFFSQYWLSPVLGLLAIILIYRDACREDNSLIKKFGDEYRSYMERVPRANVVVGIYRRFRKGKSI